VEKTLRSYLICFFLLQVCYGLIVVEDVCAWWIQCEYVTFFLSSDGNSQFYVFLVM